MEIDEEIDATNKNPTRKHSISYSEENRNFDNRKKARLFRADEFRRRLRQGDRLSALKEFLNAIKEHNEHDYVLEYLENGGNCLELLQTLELDSNLSPVIVFELISLVLLKITASGPQYHGPAFESCRYILNNYITVINKMLNLSSRTEERKVCLKLLTAMLTFSATLAKDILAHVNFHSANIELLTKHTGEENSVRDHFIHFLTAFLIDGYYQSLSVLLEKKGLITSIIKGLQFDVADTVCVVISAMKNHILQNPSVSKTAKMKVFNTMVVRDIVSLYNWKGPAALKAQGKNKVVAVTVDEYSKSKVSECVHDFLLVLCTSHKYGVIFKDHSLGLGKKNQNALMYTVLDSLDRPWDHSYASELVTKICVACPDLTKTMWTNLKSSLEPRLTEKWLGAVKFSKNLLKELQPACIEFCAKELNVTHLAQGIEILAAPLPILKVLIPENRMFPDEAVKIHILSLLLEMLKSLDCYVQASKDWLNPENHDKLKAIIASYVTKNFIDATFILNDLETKTVRSGTEENVEEENFLQTVFGIFDLYNKLSPQLLDSLNAMSVQIIDFLKKIGENCGEGKRSLLLQVKTINIFVDLEPSNFSPNTEIFSFVFPLLLRCYYETVDSNALAVLNKLLKYTGIFEGCEHEINIWINGILNVRHVDDNISQDVVEIVKLTASSAVEYSEELSLLNVERDSERNIERIIEKLMNFEVDKYDEENIIVKHLYFSPMILGLINYLKGVQSSKKLKSYVNFVLLNLFNSQTNKEMLTEFVKKYEEVPENIREYVLSWTERGETIFFDPRGRIHVFESFSDKLYTEDFENDVKSLDISIYPDLPLNLLQTNIFYMTCTSEEDGSFELLCKNCVKFIKYSINLKLFEENYLEVVLAHPKLLSKFSLLELQTSVYTKFMIEVIRMVQSSNFDISSHLKIYRAKLVKAVLKFLHKPKEYSSLNFKDALQLLGLGYDQCCKVLTECSQLSVNDTCLDTIMEIMSYTLKQISSLYQCEDNSELLEAKVVEDLIKYFVTLIKESDVNLAGLPDAFLQYFKVFPHHIKQVNQDLFLSLMHVNEYSKDNVQLIVFLLERNIQFIEWMNDNLKIICSKKGVLLPILDVLIRKNVEEKTLEQIYEYFEPSLLKALLKPQKAGQHFHVSYGGVVALIKKFMPIEKCQIFTEKVQKFEVTEVFHAKLLAAVFHKVIDGCSTTKSVNNIILTFIHMLMQIFKRNAKDDGLADPSKVIEVGGCFNSVLNKINTKEDDIDLKSTAQSAILKSFVVFCLKYGLLGQTVLLKLVRNTVKALSRSMVQEDAKLILDMLVSHSKFLDIVLDEHSPVKFEILMLFMALCQNWSDFMERFHIPVFLAGYRAMINPCDKIILKLLKMYAGNPGQTSFYDFKPFLWGRAAANHYSVRQNPEKSLLRQPKMRDVMDILQEDMVCSSICNYPFNEKKIMTTEEIEKMEERRCYDLDFLLPLFSQLLAAEQQVQTYAFSRSGALSLTVLALSSEQPEIRDAACHVLMRYYFHVEASQRGKDNLLWMRYVEAVCKGLATLTDRKLNNFSAIYLARMALILTQPTHVMYVPLSQHLTAKSSLDFGTIPELYTFLHSSDINYRAHRSFILELLRDGLKSDRDLLDFQRSMAFKLFSELFNSSLADLDVKLLILDIIVTACKIPSGAKTLCENHSLLPQMYQVLSNILGLPFKEKQETKECVSKIVRILFEIVEATKTTHARFIGFNSLLIVVKDDIFSILCDADRKVIFELFYLISNCLMELFTDEVLDVLLKKCNDRFCKYVLSYGSEYVNHDCLKCDDVFYYLRLLFINKMKLKG